MCHDGWDPNLSESSLSQVFFANIYTLMELLPDRQKLNISDKHTHTVAAALCTRQKTCGFVGGSMTMSDIETGQPWAPPVAQTKLI